MENILQLSIQLLHLVESVNERFNTLRKNISEIDIQLQEVEHEIEFAVPFNVVRGYRFALRIRDIRQKRRLIKEEFEVIQSLKCIIDNNSQMFINIEKWLNRIPYLNNNVKHEWDLICIPGKKPESSAT